MENIEYQYFQYDEDIKELTAKIEVLSKKLERLSKKKFYICKNMALQIMQDNIKNQTYIESILDNLLDVLLYYEQDEVLVLYKNLCSYYFYINPEATQEYINLYREQCDPNTENSVF